MLNLTLGDLLFLGRSSLDMLAATTIKGIYRALKSSQVQKKNSKLFL